MTIKPNKRQMVSFIKEYWQTGRRVLDLTAQPLINLIGNVPIEEVKARAPQILDTPEMRKYLTDIWVDTGSWFATDMMNKLATRVEKDENFWADSYRAYISSRVANKAKQIARTEATLINSLIDVIQTEAMREGYSIDTIAEKIKYELGKRLREVHKWEAERIARTEVIGASNKGSFDAAFSSGLDVKKAWLTSGLQGVRPSHAGYEGIGFVPMNYSYAPGLRHPGDPEGAAEEVINCRCTIIYET